MSKLRRIVLVRHGETTGNSRTRFHGSSDLPLSDEGRTQMREAAYRLRTEAFDLVAASPLRRSWESASIVSGGAPVRLDSDFREVHFGRWEGLTAEEIEQGDPALYADWQAKAPGFEYPSGEKRDDFRARVERGLARVEASTASQALLVVHKGVIRVIAEKLLGEPLPDGEPELGGIIGLGRAGDGSWFTGRRGSNPRALDEEAA
ncbi:MAG: histidine phosphatase family protein [Myxococcota bacterium]